MGTAPWIVVPTVCVLLTACAVQPAGPEGEPTASAASPIYGGVEDNDARQNDAVVAIKIGAPGASMVTLCSGSLVAPNVVLTARHCISQMTASSVTCDQNGVSATAPDFGADQPIADIGVYMGPVAALAGAPQAGVKAVFHPAGNTLCNLDLALLVLDTSLTVAAPLRVRLKSGITSGESIRAVGYGQNDQGAGVGTRFRKDSVAVLAIGSTVSASQTPLGSNEFEVGESMCEGDSGGPAIDETTGAIVGIVSRGGACTDAFGHVYTSLEGLGSVFTQAFAMAGGAPIDESAPASGGDGGASGGSSSSSSGGAASSGSSGGASSSTGSSGGTGGGSYDDPPVNLRSGAGKNCAIAPGDAPASSAPWMTVVALAMTRMRRRRKVG